MYHLSQEYAHSSKLLPTNLKFEENQTPKLIWSSPRLAFVFAQYIEDRC